MVKYVPFFFKGLFRYKIPFYPLPLDNPVVARASCEKFLAKFNEICDDTKQTTNDGFQRYFMRRIKQLINSRMSKSKKIGQEATHKVYREYVDKMIMPKKGKYYRPWGPWMSD